MKNAHLLMGSLQFTKMLRDTTIDITLRMDRMIAEHDADNRSARCHLLSVIGNDQEVAAIAAAIADFREAAPKRTSEQIHRALEAALHEEPAPSLNEIARRLGYGTTTRVRNADSDLCRQIVLRHRKSGRSHWWRRCGAKPICELSRIRAVLEEYLASDGPIPPLDRISASLGCAEPEFLC